MAKLTIESDRVLQAAKEGGKEVKSTLVTLFPEVFEDELPFIKIGTVLTKKNLNNHYAVFKWNGEIRFLNITNNQFWNSDRNLKVSELKDREGIRLTRGEFKSLIGAAKVEDFKIVPIND